MTRSVELKLYAYRKNRDGLIVSFVVHPNDEGELTGVDIGDTFQAQLHDVEDVDQGKLQTEGERLRTRAVLLCKDPKFWQWLAEPHDNDKTGIIGEKEAILHIYRECRIQSRSELATNYDAQARFKTLERQFREETGQAAERRGG